MEYELLYSLWGQLVWPLIRIVFLVSVGIVVASFIESLNWTNRLALLARPLIRLGKMSSVAGASFSMAFFSGVSANTMLAEAFDKGKISKKELVLANLFNSLPRFFLHLPTVFFLTAPLIKGAALVYVGVTFCAAVFQTLLVVVASRIIMVGSTALASDIVLESRQKISMAAAWQKSIKRFRKRIKKVLTFMVPVYIFFFLLSRYGIFNQLEAFVAEKAWFLSWLHPQSLGIVILHVSAEFSAGLAAAGALLADNSLTYKEVVLALLAGNILSAPIRAARHQFPYYVGIFSPSIALELVGVSQVFRVVTIVFVGWCYYYFV